MVAIRLDSRRPSVDSNAFLGKKKFDFFSPTIEPVTYHLDAFYLPEFPTLPASEAYNDSIDFLESTYDSLDAGWVCPDQIDEFSALKSEDFLKREEALLSQVARQEECTSELGLSDEESETLVDGLFSLPESEESSDETETFIDSVLEWDGSVRKNVVLKKAKNEIVTPMATRMPEKPNKAPSPLPNKLDAFSSKNNTFKAKSQPKKRYAAEEAVSATFSNKRHKASLEEKRSQHNEMERKRREELKDEFCALKKVLPDLGEEKTPKICILEKANVHIQNLVTKTKECSVMTEKAKQERETLERKLSFLRSLLQV